ncbi:unnamed protein product [Rotaria magnacalcarata]
MVLQYLFIQLLQRCYNKYRYKQFLTTLEIGLTRRALLEDMEMINSEFQQMGGALLTSENLLFNIQSVFGSEGKLSLLHEKFRKRFASTERKMKFDFIDLIVHVLPVVAHSLWYCVIQSSRMSAQDATIWNCYNLFGYRLYNYVFVSYISFCLTFFVKLLAQMFENRTEPEHGDPKQNKKPRRKISHVIGLCSSTIGFFFVGTLILPYIFTNIIPMFFIYIFMFTIYISCWVTIFTFVASFHRKENVLKGLLVSFVTPANKPTILKVQTRIFKVLLAFSIELFPMLLTIFYNYSQYIYYGEDYYETMTNEFNSRNTSAYFNRMEVSIEQIFHTILSSI